MKSIHFIDEITSNNPIYIYGTGAAGKLIFSRINSEIPGVFRGFVDSYAKGEIGSFPILDPVSDKDILKDATILVASQHWAEIEHRMESIGISNIFNAYPLYLNLTSAQPNRRNAFLKEQLQNELVNYILSNEKKRCFAVVGKKILGQ